MKRVLSLVVAGVLAVAVHASVHSTIDPKQTLKVKRLPEQVVSRPGSLSLFADYANATNGVITLYLVNRSGKDIDIPCQDYDPYAKLEGELDGRWVRAQEHVFSWCGNSYMTAPTLKDGYCFTVQAPVDARYDDLTQIIGFWLEKENEVADIIIRPRKTVTWFRAPGKTASNRLRLAPGKSRTFNLKLGDYYDLAALNGTSVGLTARCRLPGIHQIPYSDSSTHYLPIRPPSE